ncbi:hypothetical protein [Sinorhizobium fredii]|uniref:hypothetical protein n=1 Tax=Rhizobium fredii TaxID=380 RepID=UPI001FE23DAB|nr:hypothetical protein [Sinorhizobium fredii]
MRKPGSMKSLEDLGRVRLSKNFFLRDFLHSEIADFYRIPNIPDDPDLAVEAGCKLCEELLEPLQATFGRLHIRSAYRNRAVNEFGNANKLNCSTNAATAADHIWDMRDADGCMGATACIVIPWVCRAVRGTAWVNRNVAGACPVRRGFSVYLLVVETQKEDGACVSHLAFLASWLNRSIGAASRGLWMITTPTPTTRRSGAGII